LKEAFQSELLYAWYGDDFTGSTDVLEALGLHGVPAVLFTHPPGEADLKAFAHCRAVGIAGESRSRDPRWMSRNLPAVFTHMRQLGALVNHYKVCSTFDSSPIIGNIGRAMELGLAAFASEFVPIVVGAPHLGRYVAFGNLFASGGDAVHRIDRHPTMRCHPVTPMKEADLRRHLAKQSSMPIGLVDLTAFENGTTEDKLREELAAGAEAMLFDGCNDAMLNETARLISDRAQNLSLFAVGSSGLTHGLLRHWARLGLIQSAGPAAEIRPASSVDRLLVLSGSCSPVTARQIERSRQMGFEAWRLVGSEPWGAETRKALEALAQGRSVVLYTALGPENGNGKYGKGFAAALGRRLRNLLQLSGVRRVLITGGDTSTHVVKQLEIDAMTFAAPLVPGVPLCRSHAPGSSFDGLELALKGGQMGGDEFFAQVRDGRSA
jgi:uncharacterized protein YgbK (DUF1537 family)